MMEPPPLITTEEYAARRDRVLEALDGAAALVLAGQEVCIANVPSRWKTDRLFWYLTGLDHEAGAAVLFDPSAEDPRRRVTLFLRHRDPEVERWDGPRDPLDSQLERKLGFSHLRRTGHLPALLTAAARRTKRLACLHPFTAYTEPLSPDLELFQKVVQHVPGVAIEDRTQLLPEMRAVKSSAELALIERAAAVTAAGFADVLRGLRPGLRERDLADRLLAVYRAHDAEPAYELIVGAGPRSTVLHYRDNDALIEEGDLVVMDCAAAYGGYASDVTRTFPASGAFTQEQRRVYEIVLRAQQAAIAAAGPGATFTDVDRAARTVIEDAGYGDAFIHGTSHPLGAEVHDVAPDGPLRAGMVITVEPGIYLPERGFGVRIEDDVLITPEGRRDLTGGLVPRTVEEIEAALRR
jgi:Xaa-Pro aminopeptidase